MFSCMTRIKAELMIPVGIAIMAIPIMLMDPPGRRPHIVRGQMSPYPTVVKETAAYRKSELILLKTSGCAFLSM